MNGGATSTRGPFVVTDAERGTVRIIAQPGRAYGDQPRSFLSRGRGVAQLLIVSVDAFLA
ncbi:MAG: hypothetical protein Gyms2KO_13440 [Gymnodinialimonas sp.]